jgi:hypothetical protein
MDLQHKKWSTLTCKYPSSKPHWSSDRHWKNHINHIERSVAMDGIITIPTSIIISIKFGKLIGICARK